MIPWGAWLYLLLLAAVGVLHLVVELRARAGVLPALLRFAAVGVIATGVVLFYRGGAGVAYMLLLFVAALLVSRKSVEDAQAARATRDAATAPPPWLGLTRLVVLPGIAWGALAVWVQQHA